MGSTWVPPGFCRPQMDPMLAPWALLSGKSLVFVPTGPIDGEQIFGQVIFSKLTGNRYLTQFCQNSLQWRHNEHNGVSDHHPHDCLLHGLFRRRSKKTLKLRVTGLCAGNSPVNSLHKGSVTRKLFPFDDVIMYDTIWRSIMGLNLFLTMYV